MLWRLRVRERVGSSLIMGRPGKPSGSGGFDAAVCEKESKGLVSDFQGVVSAALPSAVVPVEVVRRSGAVGAVRDRSETDFKGELSGGASGAGVALCAATVSASSASSAGEGPRVCSRAAETTHATADEGDGSETSGTVGVESGNDVTACAADQAGVLHGISSLFLNSRIHPKSHGYNSRINRLSHSPHARARAVDVAALPPVRLLQLLLMLHVHAPHLCIVVHLSQGVLVVCCLCANPPVTT